MQAVLADHGPRGQRCRFHAIPLYFIVSTRKKTRGSLCPSCGEQRNFSESSWRKFQRSQRTIRAVALSWTGLEIMWENLGHTGNRIRWPKRTPSFVKIFFSSFFLWYPPNLPSHKEDTVHPLGLLGPSARGSRSFGYCTFWVRHNHDEAATGYDHNWVRLQLGVRCYGVRAARGCGNHWMRAVTGCCYNRVRLKLGAIATGAQIQLGVPHPLAGAPSCATPQFFPAPQLYM